ncbi:MAG: ABC transporter ATP-binding protein [Chitinophagaceae bacterium]|nr:MAG: ABC transporter ATP-binding protein [Chitinophagaceae bacterium]
MNLITVEDLSKSFGADLLFEKVTFGIEKGEKTALIAKNGTGKTTLMRIIAGQEVPDSGKLSINNNVRISFLTQTENFLPTSTPMEVMFDANHPAVIAFKNYKNILSNEKASDEDVQKALDAVEKTFAWDIEEKAAQLLAVFGLATIERQVKHLSGGQIKRLALARTLLEEPDLILMDEPTNHLDMDMIEWLENYIKKLSSAVLMVTHDRYFLERVCQSIIELDDKKLYKYKGNYSYYIEKKAAREEQEITESAKLKNQYKKELEWMRRQPKARTTKSKQRTAGFYEIESKANVSKDDKTLKAEIKPDRMGSKILELKKISKKYDEDEIITDFTYSFKKNEKIGIVGKNGSGKSTLLNIITGKTMVDTGKVVVGETIKFGYYKQSGIEIKAGKRVIEFIRDVAEHIPLSKGRSLSAAQMLENFLFPRSMHFQYIEKLSGGEKKRLYLLSVLMGNPNFLILDEPTNDLDIYTIQALEEYLQNFEGCLLIVSHDRFFLDKTVGHIFVLDEKGGQIVNFPGNYSHYYIYKENKISEEKKQLQAKKIEAAKPVATVSAPKNENKLTYKERQEFNKIEKKIEELESKKSEIESELYDAGSDAEKTIELSEKLNEISGELDEKMIRWIELSEKEM